MIKYRKTRAERQQWWNRLTPEEQQDYIHRQQHKKMERRHAQCLLREDQNHLDSIKAEIL